MEIMLTFSPWIVEGGVLHLAKNNNSTCQCDDGCYVFLTKKKQHQRRPELADFLLGKF